MLRPWAWLPLVLSGCSLLVPFDPNLPPDGGSEDVFDGGYDGGIDGGVDGGYDAGYDAGPPPELCNNGRDDDGDGLSDCHDSDCARESGCCLEGERSALLLGQWRTQGWRPAPSTLGIFPQAEDGSIVGFEPSDVPLAAVSEECIPMALGHDIAVDWELSSTFSPAERGCDAGGRCTDYASLVLTPTTDMLPGNRLFHELAVVVYPSGRVAITQNDIERFSTSDFEPGQRLRVQLSLRPKLDEGQPHLEAIVSIARASSPDSPVIWEGFVVALNDLLQEGPCATVPGLHIAFEGRGEGVRILRGADRQGVECVNPNLFGNTEVVAEAPLVAGPGVAGRSSLGFEVGPGETPACAGDRWEAWATEGLGAPSLLGENTGSTTRWHVVAEASNGQPELEVAHRVGYAIGYASQRESNWNIDWLDTSACPSRGTQPPSCTTEGCPESYSFREPFLGPNVFAYARELEPGNERFGIVLELRDPFPPSPGPGIGDVIAPPEGFSYRDPMVLADPSTPNHFLVFVSTTAVSGSARSHIDALLVSDVGSECTGAPPCIIAGPARILDGSIAGNAGVWNPEVLVDPEGSAMLFRLWYLATTAEGRTAIHVALGRRNEGEALPSGFVTYAGNPVLTPNTPSLRCDEPGLSACTIEGFAVARDPNPSIPHALRFLVARNVRLSDGNRRRELVPLQQAWRASSEPLR